MNVKMLSIEKIKVSGNNPRKVINTSSVETLAETIKTHGVLQPLRVLSDTDGMYILLLGERRLLAAKMAGLSEVPCIVDGDVSDNDAVFIRIIENTAREDLCPLDKARIISDLAETGMNHVKLGKLLNINRNAVSDYQDILKLPSDIQTLFAPNENGQHLDKSHAVILRKCINFFSVEKVCELALNAFNQGLSCRELKKLVEKLQKPKPIKQTIDPDTMCRLETIANALSAKTGLKFKIKIKPDGSIDLIVSVENTDNALDDFMKQLSTT
jgi:ParB family chromosome partitioning protein